MTNENKIWLPEPQVIDNTFANSDEHMLDWLARSTLPRAKACRRFLKQNIAALPQDRQQYFQRDLREKWESSFFELIVGRTLQLLGASIEIELENSDGHNSHQRDSLRIRKNKGAYQMQKKVPYQEFADKRFSTC